AENSYWQVEGRILPGEYNVQLFAVWKGPSSDTLGYHLTKTCQISQVPADLKTTAQTQSSVGRVAPNTQVGTANVSCGSVTKPIKGQPDMAK
ncbi:MAG: DUF5357 domain-containing protein, partial [Leptolyngbyaceae cyanobacterium CAN_BIN12]|nr:DUF5357 domain-containing protein [Leptolyngbyaceae cyanobacterium CAN_BIN12]